MADSFSDRLWRYLRQTKQRWETLAAKTELPPQVIKRLLYLDDEEPPQYVLDRLSRVTGQDWGGSAAANENFAKPLPTEAETFNVAFFRSSTKEQRRENPFGDIQTMTADTPKKETIHDLFANFKEEPAEARALSEDKAKAAEGGADINTEKENLREHIRIGVRLRGSASKYARELGTTSVTVSNWLTKYYPRETFYKVIADSLGVAVDDLFEPPSSALVARLENAPRMRGSLKNGAAIFGESAYLKNTLKELSESADRMGAAENVPEPSSLSRFDIEGASAEEAAEPTVERREVNEADIPVAPASPDWIDAVSDEDVPQGDSNVDVQQGISNVEVQQGSSNVEVRQGEFDVEVQQGSESAAEVHSFETIANVEPRQGTHGHAEDDFSDEDEEDRQPRFLNDIPVASGLIAEPAAPSPGPERKPASPKKSSGKAKDSPLEDKKSRTKEKSGDREESSDIADLIPDGSQSQTVFSDRLTAYMNDNELSLGDMCEHMPRRRKDIYRLQNIVLGRTTPKFKEVTAFARLFGVSVEQIRIESCLPGKNIRSLRTYADVCLQYGLFEEVPAAPAPVKAEAPDTLNVELQPGRAEKSVDAPDVEGQHSSIEHDTTEAIAADAAFAVDAAAEDVSACATASAPASTSSNVEVRQGSSRVEVRQGRTEHGRIRGITALEYGSGSLAFAAGDASGAFVFSVRDSELLPTFPAESAVIVSTEGFDPDADLTPADFPGNGWYVIRLGRREELRHVTAGMDYFAVSCGNERYEETLLTLSVVGRAVAVVAAKVL